MKPYLNLKRSILPLIFLLTMPLHAALIEEKLEKDNNKNPIGCRNSGYAFELKTLKLSGAQEAAQSLFFIFNTSNQTINLFQMLNEESTRSLYLNHMIPPGHWSALAISEMPIKFLCTTPRKADFYGDVIDCGQTLKVCQFVNVKFGLNNGGNFWLINSGSRNTAVREVVRYGIIPDYRVSEKKEKPIKKGRFKSKAVKL
jgi:hypothetical protein